MEVLFLWVGLLFTVLGILVIRSARDDESRGSVVTGEIIGYAARADGDSPRTFAPVVVWRDGNLRRFIVESPLASGSLPWAVGERVRLLVTDGVQPRARIATRGIVGFGTTFVAVGLFCTALFFTIFSWNLISIGIAVALTIGLVLQLRRAKVSSQSLAATLLSIRHATAAEAVPEMRYERSRLVPPLEVHALRRRIPRQTLAMGIVMLLLAAGCVGGSWYWFERRAAFLRTAVEAEGIVVDMEMSSGESTTWAPVVEFTPASSWGAPVRFRHPGSSSHPSWGVGDRVRVLHDPVDPANAMIRSTFWNRGAPLIPGVIGMLLALLGIVSIRSALRRSVIA